MSFKPIGKRVLIKREESEAKTASGIILTDSAKEKPSQGEVIEISEGAKAECGCFNKGDTVLFNKYQGDEVKIDGQDFIILELKDILGVIKK